MSTTTSQLVAQIFQEKGNIMKWFRDQEGAEVNTDQAILMSYDFQSGAYINRLKDKTVEKQFNLYCKSLALVLDSLKPQSINEAGIGEATTLAYVLKHMVHTPTLYGGFDISWSRIAFARHFLKRRHFQGVLSTGNYNYTPLIDNAVDVIYTSHSIEPNRGREKHILQELYRATRKYLVLLEPSNELGSEETKKHIEEHKYCLDLYNHAIELGYKVIEHKLFDHIGNPHNQTALLLIEKTSLSKSVKRNKNTSILACPLCKHQLSIYSDHAYCPQCFHAFPVILGIPCLLPHNAVLASKHQKFS